MLIHPTAVIESGAQLGENVKVGPYSYIGNDVVIGDNTIIESHVVAPKENKETICDEMNGMINVPLVSEKKEEACIKSIFDAVVEVLEKVLSKFLYYLHNLRR